MSKCGVFSGPYFPVFGPEKTPYLDTSLAIQLLDGKLEIGIEIEGKSICFIDLKISIVNDKLESTVNSTLTESHLYLNTESCHKSSCIILTFKSMWYFVLDAYVVMMKRKNRKHRNTNANFS